MKRTIIIHVFSIFLLVGNVFAQENKIKKAEEEFSNYDYIDARKIYLSVVEDGYKSAQVFEKLGDTYYFNSEYAEANTWYGKLMDNYPDQVRPEYYFRTAQTLKSVGKYEESKKMMEKFKLSSPSNLANSQLNNWQSFENLTNSEGKNFKVTNITSEMAGSDFGPAFYGDKIVFASSSKNTEGSKVHDWNGQPYLDLFEAEIGENGNLTNVISLKGDINSPYHESSAVFTRDGTTVYFTRNNYIDGKKKRGKKRLVGLKIYKATKIDERTWGNVQELPFNWGPNINTEQRETFPFISEENTLFFSSDGHFGLGGLDVFRVSKNNDPDVAEIINLGQPINSNQDDFGFIVKENEKIGYLSSNRDGDQGSGSDDIYAIAENCNAVIYGAITDANTNDPLEGSVVYLLDENSNVVSQKITGANGNYEFDNEIDCQKQYVIRASNDEKEYLSNEKVVLTPQGSNMLQVDIALTPPDCPINDLGCRLDLQPIYFDFDKHNIRSDAEVELAKILQAMKEYPQLRIHIESHTDSRGNDDYNVQLSERRAKSTLEWLVNKGIDRSRLSSKGYGESQLINNCSNGINCSEEEHQLNRRSMFIIQ